MKRNIILGLLLLAAVTAGAETIKDGIHAAFVTGGDIQNEDFAYGYQAAYEFNDNFSVEFSLTRQLDEIQHAVNEVPLPPEFNIDMEVYALAFSARAGFNPLARLHLYAGGGIGYYIIKSDAEDVREVIADRNDGRPYPGQLLGMNVDVDNDFGFHLGVGLEIELSDKWQLFAEYRHVMLEPDAKVRITEQFPAPDESAPFLRTTREIPDSLDYNYEMVRAGINYVF